MERIQSAVHSMLSCRKISLALLLIRCKCYRLIISLNKENKTRTPSSGSIIMPFAQLNNGRDRWEQNFCARWALLIFPPYSHFHLSICLTCVSFVLEAEASTYCFSSYVVYYYLFCQDFLLMPHFFISHYFSGFSSQWKFVIKYSDKLMMALHFNDMCESQF